MVFHDRTLTEWFLAHGADPNARCTFDITPLSKAVISAPLEIIQLLFRHGGSVEKGQFLHNVIHRQTPDSLQVAQMLIDRGCSINAIMYQNHTPSYQHYQYGGLGTPLYKAARCGNLEMVELFLQNGADPLIHADGVVTPIEAAECNGHTPVVELLRPLS